LKATYYDQERRKIAGTIVYHGSCEDARRFYDDLAALGYKRNLEVVPTDTEQSAEIPKNRCEEIFRKQKVKQL